MLFGGSRLEEAPSSSAGSSGSSGSNSSSSSSPHPQPELPPPAAELLDEVAYEVKKERLRPCWAWIEDAGGVQAQGPPLWLPCS